MKLGIITHIRCGEDGNGKTLVWLPDAMTEEEFAAAVRQAQDEYLAFVDAYDAATQAKAPNEYRDYAPPPYEKHQLRTVAEVKADWEAKKIAWRAWKATRDQARKTFGDYLRGKAGIQRFWEHEPEAFAIDVNWGHRHGVRLNYDTTDYD